jgi:hypothetical protein
MTALPKSRRLPLIKVVGVSASGKSTLVAGLRQAGYDARPVSQEHSNVPDLWRQFEPPRYLIYLSVSLDSQQLRRPDVTWTASNRRTEEARLAHAREHADLRIDTTHFSARDVLRLACTDLRRRRISHAAVPLAPVLATGSSSTRAN